METKVLFLLSLKRMAWPWKQIGIAGEEVKVKGIVCWYKFALHTLWLNICKADTSFSRLKTEANTSQETPLG